MEYGQLRTAALTELIDYADKKALEFASHVERTVYRRDRDIRAHASTVTLNPGDVFRIPVTVGAHGRHEHPYMRFVYRYADGTRIAAVNWRVPE